MKIIFLIACNLLKDNGTDTVSAEAASFVEADLMNAYKELITLIEIGGAQGFGFPNIDFKKCIDEVVNQGRVFTVQSGWRQGSESAEQLCYILSITPFLK